MRNYTGTDTYPESVLLCDDGDPLTPASFSPAQESLADRTVFLRNRQIPETFTYTASTGVFTTTASYFVLDSVTMSVESGDTLQTWASYNAGSGSTGTAARVKLVVTDDLGDRTIAEPTYQGQSAIDPRMIQALIPSRSTGNVVITLWAAGGAGETLQLNGFRIFARIVEQ